MVRHGLKLGQKTWQDWLLDPSSWRMQVYGFRDGWKKFGILQPEMHRNASNRCGNLFGLDNYRVSSFIETTKPIITTKRPFETGYFQFQLMLRILC